MADKPVRKKRQLRKIETVRERSSKPAKEVKARKLHGARRHITRPIKAAANIGRKEYYLPMPDNRLGKFLNKKRKLVPTYFKSSFKELRQVEWPDRSTTWHLTLAVFMFAFFFGLLVAVTDYGLDKLFKRLIIK